MSAGRLEGKRAIVTGAGRGIGRAIAAKFLAEGARLVLCDLVPERIVAAAEDLGAGGEVYAYAGDVTDPAFCRTLVEAAETRLGGFDVLANNAGIVLLQPFLDQTAER